MDEQLIVEEINKLRVRPRYIAGLLIEEDEERLLQLLPIESLEELRKGFSQNPEVFDELEAWAREEITAREYRKSMRDLKAWGRRAANRSAYVPSFVLTAYDLKNRIRFQHKRDVQCAGLLEQMVEHLHGRQPQPVGAYFQDNTKDGVPDNVWDVASQLGVRNSKGKLLWNTRSVGWKYLRQTFPVFIDLSAYGHSLMTPLVPHGFVPECPVTLRRLKDHLGRDVQTDGSGIYHPQAPQLQALMAQYGPVALQFRYLNCNGVFAKGMLFPSELAVDTQGVPTVVIDWLQVKGSKKSLAKTRYEEDAALDLPTKGFLGVFRCRHRATGMSSSFEIVENLLTNDRTKEIVRKKVENAVARIIKRGPMDLLRKVEAKDENITHMVRIIRVLQETGTKISPMQVDRIRRAVQDALGKELYRIAQGAGLRFRAHDARLDCTLKPGTCVVSGLPAGISVACIRFPTVLSQGLPVLKSTMPLQHHLYDGQMPPGVIIMHPLDLVRRMQGDDDGDTIGVSTDPEVVELFRHKVDNNIYLIEPESDRLEFPTESPEGEKLMRHSQRGDEVGMLTILRSQLLAVGDIAGANALSISIQEAVDRQKKIVKYSDFRLAANLANWEQTENGYRFHERFPEEVTPLGVFPLKLAEDWVGNRLIRAGCFRDSAAGTVRPIDPLTWRQKTKTLDLESWQPCRHKNGFRGQTLVHFGHDVAWKYWHEHNQEFSLDHEQVEMEPLLYRALEAHGVEAKPYRMTDDEYADLYARSGLRRYNEKLKEILDSNADMESRHFSINQEQRRCEKSLQALNMEELLTIWKYSHKDGQPNNALRAICWNQSPVLLALDLQEPTKCQFLTAPMLQGSIEKAVADEQPHKKLQEMVLANTTHAERMEDIPLYRCPDCMDSLQEALVNHIRYRDVHDREAFMTNLTSSLNSFLRFQSEEQTTASTTDTSLW